ncbi:hypothetical protein FA95DRAFT_885392 [Auriscalpium vulgare]|uniref:Uncharacterized protein n=1 Tax=Auriscalpium vulgare TaxID=40419 RepID=A0ACB8R997_9AGAM|nr:hypothetical protein FA95DRAFT_885392 [Auriscalpium vulgare]
MPSRILDLPPADSENTYLEMGGIRDTPRPLPNPNRRVPRAVAYQSLQPIRELRRPEFVKAWYDCVKCHYRVWKDIQLRDPSLANVMYYKDSDGTVHGILNDWDLGNIAGEHTYLERTGTIPFMPLALLNSEYWDGKIARTYYHDLESFVWVLVFVFLSFGEDGKRLKKGPRPADTWETGDYEECHEKKLVFVIDGMEKEDIAEVWKDDWPLAQDLLAVTAGAWVSRLPALNFKRQRTRVRHELEPVIDPTSDDTYYKTVIEAMEDYGYSVE